nr:MerR family transcriptional regulator [Propionibacterium sp.]
MQAGDQGRYTVKQVAALTGVLETTLRVWERRYQVVTPTRSPGGYRLYDDDQVARLRLMAALVAEGVPASVAAKSLPPLGTAAASATEARSLADLDLVATALSLDPARLDALLAEVLERAPFEQVVDAWLLPELARLGQAWAAGEISVAHEHFVTAGVIRLLGRIFHEAPEPGTAPVLVGLAEGANHELGLLAFAACLRRAGVSVVYLGANVPVSAWLTAAETLRPRAAVIGAPLGARVRPVQELVDRLRALTPPVAVWVGGGLAGRLRGAGLLPAGVARAASEVATELRSGLPPDTHLGQTLDKMRAGA